MELLSVLDLDQWKVRRCSLKVLIECFCSQKANLVVFKRCYDCFQILGLGELQCFRVNEHKLLFKQLGWEHALKSEQSNFGVNREGQVTGNWTPCFTTTHTTVGTLITFSRSTLAFLWGWLLTGTWDVGRTLGKLIGLLAEAFPIVVNVMYDVSSERLIEDFRVKLNRLLFKLASDNWEDWDFKGVGSVDDEWFLECALVNQCRHFVLFRS